MKLGALGLPAYRTFSLEELEYATNNFESSAFMGEGSQGQVINSKLSSVSKFCTSEVCLHCIEKYIRLIIWDL